MSEDFRPSGFDRRGGERRAVSHIQPPPPESWHLDKKVPIGFIFALIVQTVSVVWFFADLKKDVELLKQDAAALHVRDSQNIDSLNSVVKNFTDQYRLLDAKLDRLIERNTK